MHRSPPVVVSVVLVPVAETSPVVSSVVLELVLGSGPVVGFTSVTEPAVVGSTSVVLVPSVGFPVLDPLELPPVSDALAVEGLSESWHAASAGATSEIP